MNTEKKLKQEIVSIGKRLYDFRLVAAKGGNLSARLSAHRILITASGTCLGELKEKEILAVDLRFPEKTAHLTTEFALHSLIYKSFPAQRVIHCHPPLTNAYFSLNNTLKNITFENKLFLGDVPCLAQSTPSITQPEKVITELKTNNIVVIKNHGVVCIGDEFTQSFYLIEELEEAVKMAAVARLFDKEAPDLLEQQLKTTLQQNAKKYLMFSKEHILTIVRLINQDASFLEKAKELNLTTQVAILLSGKKEAVFKFNFKQGKIVNVEYDDRAPFVISGPSAVWELIFAGKLNPFVATTQGKLKLKGELGKLSRWYVPFTRMFSLFTLVGVK